LSPGRIIVRKPVSGQNGHRRTAAVLTLAVLASGFFVYQRTEAAFNSTTSSTANRFNAGKVLLSNSQSGTAMFSLGTNGYLKPGQSGFFCIQVDYTGNVASTNITLTATGYANAGNTDPVTYKMGTKVNLTIEQSNTGTAVKADCDANNATWTGAKTTIFNAGTIHSFNTANGAALSPAWAPTGASADRRVFKFSWDVNATTDDNYQSATTDIGFVWSAAS
jgi:hypothetical protein